MRKYAFLRAVLLFAFTLAFSNVFAQERKISGTITDERGNPLSGATVTVRNTGVATTTDANGQFNLTLPDNAKILVMSYVGMESQEIDINNRTAFSTSLKPSSGVLSDVVVVGYGRARRANLTSAQTSVTSKEIEKTVNVTIEQAIQ